MKVMVRFLNQQTNKFDADKVWIRGGMLFIAWAKSQTNYFMKNILYFEVLP